MAEMLGEHAVVLPCFQGRLVISYTHGLLTDTLSGPCPALSPREYPLEAYGEKRVKVPLISIASSYTGTLVTLELWEFPKILACFF